MPIVTVDATSEEHLQEIASSIAKSRKIVVITGAGISTNCGIPVSLSARHNRRDYANFAKDFRSEEGLYALIQAEADESVSCSQPPVAVDNDEPPPKRRRLTRSASMGSALTKAADDSATSTKRQLRRSSKSALGTSSSRGYTDNNDESDPQSDESPMATTVPCSQPDDSVSLSQPNGSSSSRKSLPNMKGKDYFDASVIWPDEVKTSHFLKFITGFRNKVVNEVKVTGETHKFIRTLRDGGRLVRNYTQNIDMLEAREGLCTDPTRGTGSRGRFNPKLRNEPRAGNDHEGGSHDAGCEVVQLHGSLELLRCFKCQKTTSWDEDNRLAITLAGNVPQCPHCSHSSAAREAKGRRSLEVGHLRPDIVLYGESHPMEAHIGDLTMHDLALMPEMLLIMGTSLRVNGLKLMVREFAKAVHSRGGSVVFVNNTKPSTSQWGDVIDYWVDWDCDAWINDLKVRREDIWDLQGQNREVSQKTAVKPSQSLPAPKKSAIKSSQDAPPPKNPAAFRQDHFCGAAWSWKIRCNLRTISGRGRDMEAIAFQKRVNDVALARGKQSQWAATDAARKPASSSAVLKPSNVLTGGAGVPKKLAPYVPQVPKRFIPDASEAQGNAVESSESELSPGEQLRNENEAAIRASSRDGQHDNYWTNPEPSPSEIWRKKYLSRSLYDNDQAQVERRTLPPPVTIGPQFYGPANGLSRPQMPQTTPSFRNPLFERLSSRPQLHDSVRIFFTPFPTRMPGPASTVPSKRKHEEVSQDAVVPASPATAAPPSTVAPITLAPINTAALPPTVVPPATPATEPKVVGRPAALRSHRDNYAWLQWAIIQKLNMMTGKVQYDPKFRIIPKRTTGLKCILAGPLPAVNRQRTSKSECATPMMKPYTLPEFQAKKPKKELSEASHLPTPPDSDARASSLSSGTESREASVQSWVGSERELPSRPHVTSQNGSERIKRLSSISNILSSSPPKAQQAVIASTFNPQTVADFEMNYMCACGSTTANHIHKFSSSASNGMEEVKN